MLFQERTNNVIPYQQIDIKNKRETFRKEIRKEIVTKRLSHLRKIYLIDSNLVKISNL